MTLVLNFCLWGGYKEECTISTLRVQCVEFAACRLRSVVCSVQWLECTGYVECSAHSMQQCAAYNQCAMCIVYGFGGGGGGRPRLCAALLVAQADTFQAPSLTPATCYPLLSPLRIVG